MALPDLPGPAFRRCLGAALFAAVAGGIVGYSLGRGVVEEGPAAVAVAATSVLGAAAVSAAWIRVADSGRSGDPPTRADGGPDDDRG